MKASEIEETGAQITDRICRNSQSLPFPLAFSRREKEICRIIYPVPTVQWRQTE